MPGRVAAGVAGAVSGDRLSRGVLTGRAGGHSTRPEEADRGCHPDLAAAGLGLGHLLLGDRAFVLAELAFELEVGTGVSVADVLSHE